MSRPTVVNSKRQPIPPLSLEELKFWLRIMEEHALFIKTGLPYENISLINEAESFSQQYSAHRVRAEKVQSENRFEELVADSLQLTNDFYHYNRRILHLTLACRLTGSNFALFVDHLSREVEYVIRLLDKLAAGQQPLYQISSAREAAFWLRLMADHARFVVHKLDPMERSLLEMASTYSDEFDDLYLEGRDFVSMLRGEGEEIPAFRRFLQDVRVSTIRLRDFMRAAQTLIADNKLLGLVPELMADHMRREADHLLLTLAFLEKGSFVNYDDTGEYEYVNLDERAGALMKPPPVLTDDTESIPSPPARFSQKMQQDEETSDKGKVDNLEPAIIPEIVSQEEIEDLSATEHEIEERFDIEPEQIEHVQYPPKVEPVIEPQYHLKPKTKAIPGSGTSAKTSKTKWGVKLPRQLGKK
ncbi:MAG: hypothetical protein H6Q74_1216 [Firmicutes bacterium]|nr:hypothetical protein [Bacillota bacterium]